MPVQRDGGRIDFITLTGEKVARIPTGIAYDAKHGPAYGNRFGPLLNPVTNRLVDLGDGRWAVDVSVDRSWVLDPDRIFPVTLDPVVQMGRDTPGSDFTHYTRPDGTHTTDPYAAWNSIGPVEVEEWIDGCWHPVQLTARTFLHFELGQVAGRTIQSAVLRGYFTNTGNIRVGPLTNNQNIPNTYEGRDMPIASDAWNSLPITEWVQNWASGTWPNYGLELWTDEAKTFGVRAMDGAGEGPYVEVRYESPPVYENISASTEWTWALRPERRLTS
ncbi:MAG: hypothetical protein ACRD0N_14270, partial [Acidimicrobiales bacterium]